MLSQQEIKKRKKAVMMLLDTKTPKSTNHLAKELGEPGGSPVNWSYVINILWMLEREGKVELLELPSGRYWRKIKKRKRRGR